MDTLVAAFINMFLLIFGLLLLLAGVFTVYFGAGKSRKLGAGILIAGIVIMGLTYWLYGAGYTDPTTGIVNFWEYIKEPVVYLLGAITGAVFAVLLFIGVITKA